MVFSGNFAPSECLLNFTSGTSGLPIGLGNGLVNETLIRSTVIFKYPNSLTALETSSLTDESAALILRSCRYKSVKATAEKNSYRYSKMSIGIVIVSVSNPLLLDLSFLLFVLACWGVVVIIFRATRE